MEGIYLENRNEIKKVKSSLLEEFKCYSEKVNWFVFSLVIIFSYGAWIVVFGLFIFFS